MSRIKTRILIISDTHGTVPVVPSSTSPSTDDELATADLYTVPTGYRHPLPAADVVLHCGDLTNRSMLHEFENTFSMLRGLEAPLKLVIAGNHDSLLDEAFAQLDYDSDDFAEYTPKLRTIITDAEQDGVRYLTEGTYDFTLKNGAAFKVYASPYTPAYGRWGFQYSEYHEFDIPKGVDVAMTHGPPHGILDETGVAQYRMHGQPENAGCKYLLGAVAGARPRVHCFGHIHEGWGAYHCTWADREASPVSTTLSTKEDVVVEAKSRVLHELAGLKPMSRIDTSARSPEARKTLTELTRQRGVKLDLTEGNTLVDSDRQTLFLNAAIMDVRYHPTQLPWIVDLGLPEAGKASPVRLQ